MPRDQSLPVGGDLLGPSSNFRRSIQQKENTGRNRPRPKSINGSKSALPKTVGPMLDL
jgi:hypothetical protein